MDSKPRSATAITRWIGKRAITFSIVAFRVLTSAVLPSNA